MNRVAQRDNFTLPTNSLQIKFQQTDDLQLTTDGRGYDEIQITAPERTPPDWYRFSLDDGQSATLVASAIPSGVLTLELHDENDLLATSVADANGNAAQLLGEEDHGPVSKR